jgi:GntR family transcriptional regulator
MNIDTQEIVRLYAEEEHTVREIADRTGLSYGRVYGLLRSRVVMRNSGRRGRSRDTTEYLRVAEFMHRLIVTGDWPQHRKILAHQDLAKIFDVGEQTIRDAVRHLRHRGYLQTVPKKGTYVRPAQDWESASTGDRR